MTCASVALVTHPMFGATNLPSGAGGEACRLRVVQFSLRASDVAWGPCHSVGFKLAAPALAAAASPRARGLLEPHGGFIGPDAVENEVQFEKLSYSYMTLMQSSVLACFLSVKYTLVVA